MIPKNNAGKGTSVAHCCRADGFEGNPAHPVNAPKSKSAPNARRMAFSLRIPPLAVCQGIHTNTKGDSRYAQFITRRRTSWTGRRRRRQDSSPRRHTRCAATARSWHSRWRDRLLLVGPMASAAREKQPEIKRNVGGAKKERRRNEPARLPPEQQGGHGATQGHEPAERRDPAVQSSQ